MSNRFAAKLQGPDAKAIALALGGKKSGKGWIARCPAHDDQNPSLSINEGAKGRVLVRCHAGCSQAEVVAALKARDLWPGKRRGISSVDRHQSSKIAAKYNYRDETGDVLYQVVRFEPKDFRQRRPEGKGWVDNVDGVRRILYRLGALLKAIERGEVILIVEGEKDVKALMKLGIVATTNPGGANAEWRGEWSALFDGVEVCIIPDNDEVGRNHAVKVAESLKSTAKVVTILELKGLPHKGDVSDWLAAGGTASKLKKLVQAALQHPYQTEESALAEADVFDTDMANGKRLVCQFEGNVRYTPELGWLVYDGRRWVKDETGRVMRHAKATAGSIFDEIKDSDSQLELCRWGRRSQSVERLRAMIELAKSEPGVPARLADFDTDPLLLNVENGTLDLRTGELLPHARDHLITRLCPVAWDPRAKCPRFKSFLRRVLGGDEALYRYVIRAIGYSLCASTKEQVFFFLYGTGRNGKSVLTETIHKFLGDYATTARAETIMARRGSAGIPNDIAALNGPRFVSMNETGEGQWLNEPLIKEMTGGDTMSARFLRHEFFEFRPVFKLWIRGNHKPMIRGTDIGMWRRVHLIPFEVTIPEEEVDPNLAATLQGELPGILRLAVRGFLAWQRGGLRPPDRVVAAVEQYRDEMDTFGDFVRDCIEPLAGSKLPASVAYEEYQLWCTGKGEHPVTQKRFGLALQERGIKRRHTRKGSIYLGYCLRDLGPRLLYSGAWQV